MTTRRSFLKTGLTVAAVTSVPMAAQAQRFSASSRTHHTPDYSVIDDPDIKSLVQRGIDAAMSRGANFVDVRLTHSYSRNVKAGNGGMGEVQDGESITVGVRALIDGYWGFASGPIWTPDELARLGQEAAAQAKANTLGQTRQITLAPTTRIHDEQWIMPVKYDPLTMDPSEIVDFFNSIGVFVERTPGAERQIAQGNFQKQDKVYASSDGSRWTQRTYCSKGDIGFALRIGRTGYMGAVDLLTPAGEGWELFREQPIRETILKEMESIRADHKLPWKPVDVGRHAVIFDASSVASLISQTIGVATELDRALGYEANAGGTSYLNNPSQMLGTFKVGTPLLTVTGNRSAPGGAATVKWDDEGVTPDECVLIKDGILNDFATARESAGWLKDVYSRSGRNLRSHGCAYAPSGVEPPLVHTPNLVMQAGSGNETIDTLRTNMGKGLEFKSAWVNMDFQQINGLMSAGICYEIKEGKRIAKVPFAGVLFRTPEFWKGVTAMGGVSSVRRFGQKVDKGEPPQESVHSVTAVPIMTKEVTVVDIMRKA